jgi:hypothetical protein
MESNRSLEKLTYVQQRHVNLQRLDMYSDPEPDVIFLVKLITESNLPLTKINVI